MLWRKLCDSRYAFTRCMSYVKRGDPDMSKDNLFDENFEVRKTIYLRRINPFIDFVLAYGWIFKQKVQIAFGGKIPEIKSQKEVDEWDSLMYRLEEFYLEIPQRMPDQQWFHDLIDHYTKYNDYDGALDIWKWMDAHRIWINMDQDVIDKFDKFFELNDPKSLTKLSDHQQAHRLKLLEKFKQMDNNPERWWKKRQIDIENPTRGADLLPEGDRTYSGMGN